jgi:plastocyanin
MIVASPPAHVQVVAREFAFALSRRTVRAGTVVIELVNHGEDAHDLKLRRVGSTRAIRLPVVEPGAHVDRELRLQRGRYVLTCSVANHATIGMRAVLVVR